MTELVRPEFSDIETLEIQMREMAGLPVSTLLVRTVMDISRELPDNANAIAPSYGEYLAGKFLKGMELCGDLASLAFRYEHQTEALKKKEYSTAYLVRAAEKGYKRQKDQEFYAYQDEIYLEAVEKHGMAKAFRIMITQKHSAFEKAHHMMRKISEHSEGGGSLGESTRLPGLHAESDRFSLRSIKDEKDIDWDEALRS